MFKISFCYYSADSTDIVDLSHLSKHLKGSQRHRHVPLEQSEMSQAVALEKALAAILLLDLPEGPEFHVSSDQHLHVQFECAASGTDLPKLSSLVQFAVAIASRSAAIN